MSPQGWGPGAGAQGQGAAQAGALLLPPPRGPCTAHSRCAATCQRRGQAIRGAGGADGVLPVPRPAAAVDPACTALHSPLLRRVSFRVVVFRPFAEELLVGKVHKMTK